jgi:hypothetical protein
MSAIETLQGTVTDNSYASESSTITTEDGHKFSVDSNLYVGYQVTVYKYKNTYGLSPNIVKDTATSNIGFEYAFIVWSIFIVEFAILAIKVSRAKSRFNQDDLIDIIDIVGMSMKILVPLLALPIIVIGFLGIL